MCTLCSLLYTHTHTPLLLVLVSIDRITGSDTEKVPLGRYSNWNQNKAAVETGAAASAGTHKHRHANTQPPLAWHLETDTK